MHALPVQVDVLGDGGERVHSCALPVPPDALMDDLLSMASAASGLGELAVQDHLRLTVCSGPSCYDATHASGLAISSEQPLVAYFKEYRRAHSLVPHKTGSWAELVSSPLRSDGGDAGGDETTVAVGPARVRCVRTLRVPDDGKEYPLPPGLGTFPLLPMRAYAERLPSSVARRGGLLMPMLQCEAMWISFAGSGRCAARVYVGGVNAVSGRKQAVAHAQDEQDYLSLPLQPWIDGFCTEAGAIRQFVAVPFGKGYTAAEQLGVGVDASGIRIEIYPCLADSVSCTSSGGLLDLSKTPAELGLDVGQEIIMRTPLSRPSTFSEYRRCVSAIPTFVINAPLRITVKLLLSNSFTTWKLQLDVRPADTIDVIKSAIFQRDGIPHSAQHLHYKGQVLEDCVTVFQCGMRDGDTILLDSHTRRSLDSACDERMGMIAGGKIMQTIYQDTRNCMLYDDDSSEQVYIHTVSSRAWECITETIAPSSPVNSSTYFKNQYPWYSLYDDGWSAVHPTGMFDGLPSFQSFSMLARLVSKGRHPPCANHRQASATHVLRPCGHHMCSTCLDNGMSVGVVCAVPECAQSVELLVSLNEVSVLFPSDACGDAAPSGPVANNRIETLMLSEDGDAPIPILRRDL